MHIEELKTQFSKLSAYDSFCHALEEFKVIHPKAAQDLFDNVIFAVSDHTGLQLNYRQEMLVLFEKPKPNRPTRWRFNAPADFYNHLSTNEWRCWLAYLIGLYEGYDRHQLITYDSGSNGQSGEYKVRGIEQILRPLYNSAVITMDLIRNPDLMYQTYAKLLHADLIPSLVKPKFSQHLACYGGQREYLMFLITQFGADDSLKLAHNPQTDEPFSLQAQQKSLFKLAHNRIDDPFLTHNFRPKPASTSEGAINNFFSAEADQRIFYPAKLTPKELARAQTMTNGMYQLSLKYALLLGLSISFLIFGGLITIDTIGSMLSNFALFNSIGTHWVLTLYLSTVTGLTLGWIYQDLHFRHHFKVIQQARNYEFSRQNYCNPPRANTI